MSLVNWRVISRVLGALLFLEGFFVLISALVSLSYYLSSPIDNPDTFHLFISALILFFIGGVMHLPNRKSTEKVGRREGYLIVSLGWVIFALFGALPFFLSGYIPHFTDAFFETMSGFTTTGSSVVDNLNDFPHGLLFWRCFTQWLGGIGIIVFMLALVQVIGQQGGKQLFSAETTGLGADNLSPRIAGTAKKICYVYSILTLAETGLLKLGGMSFFDALCHSFTTLATGGYSTHQDSIAHWDSPYIQYVIIVFMFLAGINFTLYYFAFFKGKPNKLFKDEECRHYFFIALVFSLLVGIVVYFSPYGQLHGLERSLRDGAFQVISILSTTGFATADYMLWPPFVIVVLWLLMFSSASAGSTSGGVKVIRVTILIKNAYYELKRMIHPNAIIPIKYNEKTVPPFIITSVLAFIIMYTLTFLASLLVLAAMGVDLDTSLGAIPTCMANIGPGLNLTGPAHTFSYLPDAAKWYLSFLMLLGRLELFTLLVVFTPAFWKR